MRLIDADALTKHLEEMADNEWNKSVGSSKGLEDAIDVVESMPTIKTFTLEDIEAQYRKGLEKGLEEAEPKKGWNASCENCERAYRGADPLNIIKDSKYLFYCSAGHGYGGAETVCSDWKMKEGETK